MSKFIRHEGCPKCLSSDALAIYDDGGAHCFAVSCDYHINGKTGMTIVTTQKTTTTNPLNMAGVVSSIPQRRLSQDTCGRFGVTVEYSTTGEIIRHHYPYYKVDTGELSSLQGARGENQELPHYRRHIRSWVLWSEPVQNKQVHHDNRG